VAGLPETALKRSRAQDRKRERRYEKPIPGFWKNNNMKKLYTPLFILLLFCLSIAVLVQLPATSDAAVASTFPKSVAGNEVATVPNPPGYFIKADDDTAIIPYNASAIKDKKEVADITVTLVPSYSQASFTLLLQSHSNVPVDMRVFDMNGSVVQAWSNLPANRAIQIGNNYSPGIYLAEVTQGSRKVVVKLLKVNK
jgi:hypothetical protein